MMMDNTKLSTNCTVRQYRNYKKKGDRGKIADLIYERFYERYIEPFENNPAKHEFSMMAVACLMIESLFCFQRGRKKTGEAGGVVFAAFFSGSKQLTVFVGHGGDFYTNVRCGILHQGKTYDGWLIVRKGALFQSSKKTINATKFHAALELELRAYTDRLRKESFRETAWRAAIRKLDHICDNCLA
jgi:hypothetical protein